MSGAILIGMALMLGAITGAFKQIQNSKTISGEIVDIERKLSLDSGRTSYVGSVEYYVNGVPYIVTSGYSSSSFYVGKKMRVAYNKNAPEQSVIRPGIGIYLTIIALILFGALNLI